MTIRFAVVVSLFVVAQGVVSAGTDEASYGGRTVSSWATDLDAEKAQARYDALVAISEIGPDADAAVPAVLARIDDPHPEVATAAARTLADLGENGAIALIGALGHDETRVRAIAADALTYSEPPRAPAVEALVQRLADESETVQYLAAFALTAIAPERPEPLTVLERALRSDNLAAAHGALEAVERLGPLGMELVSLVQPYVNASEERIALAAGGALRAMRAGVLPVLLRGLKSPTSTPEGTMITIGVVGELGRADAKSAHALVALAASPNPEIAWAALRTLPQVGVADDEVALGLSALVVTAAGGPEVSLVAFETLGALGVAPSDAAVDAMLARVAAALMPEPYGRALGTAAVPLLDRLITMARGHEDPAVRARAVRAYAAGLRAAGIQAEAYPFFVRQLADDAPGPRLAAASELLTLDYPNAEVVNLIAPDITGAVDARLPVLAEIMARARMKTVDDARADAPWTRMAKRYASLFEELADGDDVTAAAWARLATAPERPLGQIVDLLGSEAPEIRRAACELLGMRSLGAEALLRVLENPNEHPMVRRAAALAYGLQAGVAETILDRLVRDRSPSRVLWWTAAVELGKNDARVLLPAVGPAIDDPERGIRSAAGLVLSRAGNPPIDLLSLLGQSVATADGEQLATTLGTLAELGSRAVSVGPTAFDRMTEVAREERAGFAIALSKMYVADVFKALRANEDWNRCICALMVVEAMDEAPTLRNAIVSCLGHPDSSVREYAARLLVQIGAAPEILVDPLVDALGDPVGLVRAEAAASLGSLGADAKDATPALEAVVAKDRFPFVRDAAREALRAIGG